MVGDTASSDSGSAGAESLPSDRRGENRHPWIAALLLTLLVGFTAYSQLDNLVAGMHDEGEKAASISDLTGGVLAWSTPSDIDNATSTWREWDADQSGGGVTRIHEAPESIVSGAIVIDYLLILVPYVVLLLFLATRLREKIEGTHARVRSRAERLGVDTAGVTETGEAAESLSRVQSEAARDVSDTGAWLDALKWLRRLVLIGAAADVVENALVLAVVRTSSPSEVIKWALVVAGRLKMWTLVVAVVGLVYVALLRPDPEAGQRRWVTGIAKYIRGLGAIRVPILAVALTALVINGPLFADQMKDVIRRWTWLHILVTLLFAGLVSTFAGVSARRIRLRLITRTPRGEKLSYTQPVALSEEERAEKERELWQTGRTFTTSLGQWIVIAGFLGLLGQFLFGLGKGLVIPAVVVAVLWVLGRPLPPRQERLTTVTARDRIIPERTPRLLAAQVPLIVGLGVIGAVVPEYALAEDRGGSWPLLFVAGIVALAAVGYRQIRRFAHGLLAKTPEVVLEEVGTVFFGYLNAAIIGLAIWLLLSDPPTADAALGEPWLLVIGAGFVALSHVVFYFFAAPDPEFDDLGVPRPNPSLLIPGSEGFRFDTRNLVRALMLGATVLTVLWLWLSPLRAPRLLGGVGVAMAFVWIVCLLAESVSVIVEKSVPPKVLEYLGVTRTPVLVLIVLWMFAAAAWLPNVGFHDVAVAEAAATGQARDVTVDQLWDRWLTNNGLPALEQLPVAAGGTAERAAVPMVFVSAWGGGIRAGVWTSYVLDCALEPHGDGRPWVDASAGPDVCRTGEDSAVASVIAMSGISGGSLGFAEYLAQLAAVGSDPLESHSWVQERMSDDYLSPVLARLFYVDIPSALIGNSDRHRDRGDLLREGWEESWGESAALDRGIFELWAEEPELPLAVMNGTSVNDGCSINVSPLDTSRSGGERAAECTTLAPYDPARTSASSASFSGTLAATHDVGSFLCDDQDLSLAAAALMSARFPVVSPTGRLTNCRDSAGMPDHIYSTDGGQLELSGTLTATQLWEALEPRVTSWNARSAETCIVPVLIHMENGFSEDLISTTSGPPNEWIDPNLWSLTSAKGGLVDNARQREALEFREPLLHPFGDMVLLDDGGEVARYAYIRTRAHPGASAPLGWTLSSATLDDLAAQLGQNAEEFRIVASWLSGDLVCGPAATG